MRNLFRLFTPGKKEGKQEEENGGAGDRARQACQVHAGNDTPAGAFVERRFSGRRRRPRHARGEFPRTVQERAPDLSGVNARASSPNHRTREVPAKMRPQSVQLRGTTLNIFPPKVTMRYCPARISRATRPKPPMLAPMRAKALWCVLNALALNMFQNWSRTKMVKNRDSS